MTIAQHLAVEKDAGGNQVNMVVMADYDPEAIAIAHGRSMSGCDLDPVAIGKALPFVLWRPQDLVIDDLLGPLRKSADGLELFDQLSRGSAGGGAAKEMGAFDPAFLVAEEIPKHLAKMAALDRFADHDGTRTRARRS